MKNAPLPPQIMENAQPLESKIFEIFRQIAPIKQASFWIVSLYCRVLYLLCFFTLGKRLHYRRKFDLKFNKLNFLGVNFLIFSVKLRLLYRSLFLLLLLLFLPCIYGVYLCLFLTIWCVFTLKMPTKIFFSQIVPIFSLKFRR